MNKNLKKLVLSAMFIAIGLVLPFATGQIREIGNMLLPMHLPVMLCGLICGWHYGAAIGFILPLLRSVLFGMPGLYPSAVAMAFELATYGFVIGFLYLLLGKSHRVHGVFSIYISLICAMLAGRAVWGVAQTILLGFSGSSFALSAFLAGAFFNAIPGIILQLVLVPPITLLLRKIVREV